MPDFAFNPRFGVPWGHARPAALALTLALLAAPPCVKAQSETAAARPSCAALNANLPPALAAWPPKIDLISAVDAAHLSRATIRLGEAAQVALHNARDINFPVQPEKPSGPAAEGGLLTFMIDRAGVYRLALSSGAWIDVIKDAQPKPSIAHAHGPACSTIRKMVDFSLEPGRYVLQVSGVQMLRSACFWGRCEMVSRRYRRSLGGGAVAARSILPKGSFVGMLSLTRPGTRISVSHHERGAETGQCSGSIRTTLPNFAAIG